MCTLIKFEIILTRIGQVIRLQNAIKSSKTACTSQMISIFKKNPVFDIVGINKKNLKKDELKNVAVPGSL